MKSFFNFKYILLLTLMVSCGDVAQKEAKTSNMSLDNYIKFDQDTSVIVEGSSTVEDLPLQAFAVDDIKVSDRTNDPILKQLGVNPFEEYLSKKIIDNSVASRYDISEVPGHIYKLNDDNTYSRVSSKRLVINNQYPKAEAVNKVYYNNKLVDKKGLEIAILFLKLNISKNQTAELIIKDEMTVSLPDELVNNELLNDVKTKLGQNNLENYYFATGATLSSISYKTFKEKRFKKGVSASWITTGGDVYSSDDSFQFKSEVALELVSLKDILILD